MHFPFLSFLLANQQQKRSKFSSTESQIQLWTVRSIQRSV